MLMYNALYLMDSEALPNIGKIPLKLPKSRNKPCKHYKRKGKTRSREKQHYSDKEK